MCTSDIEDEFHFILICPAYIDLRKTYIHKYFHTRPSGYKLTKEIGKDSIDQLHGPPHETLVITKYTQRQ